LEAFRRNRDYYSAINVAYIYKILGNYNGWHLASYIFNTWSCDTGKEWWLDSTLAETQLILGEFGILYKRMERAVLQHKPDFFKRHATRDQISAYMDILRKRGLKIQKEQEEHLEKTLDLLQDPSSVVR
ncbi:MAG: hypothetical protein K6T39_06345, partial [Anoxybacillus ayderensis]|nr:hypothetical protein [Anoxybacillus ayderensis]